MLLDWWNTMKYMWYPVPSICQTWHDDLLSHRKDSDLFTVRERFIYVFRLAFFFNFELNDYICRIGLQIRYVLSFCFLLMIAIYFGITKTLKIETSLFWSVFYFSILGGALLFTLIYCLLRQRKATSLIRLFDHTLLDHMGAFYILHSKLNDEQLIKNWLTSGSIISVEKFLLLQFQEKFFISQQMRDQMKYFFDEFIRHTGEQETQEKLNGYMRFRFGSPDTYSMFKHMRSVLINHLNSKK